MTRRKLPIGIQTFRTLREQGCYYVDKTGYAKRLADEGGRYFLSRPRRFGKSLFLDTLKELFEGSEPLFRGLAVHDRWDWSVSHAVVRLSFGAGDFTQPDYLQEDGEFLLMVINPDGWTRLAYPLFLHHGYFGGATNHDFWRSSVAAAGFDVVELGTRPATLYVLARKSRPAAARR